LSKEKTRFASKGGKESFWSIEESSAEEVDNNTRGRVSAALRRAAKNAGGKKLVVVDFGCGKGVATKEFAEIFPDFSFIGVGDVIYPAWLTNVGNNVKFVPARHDVFERYLGINKINPAVIISHFGLQNLSHRTGGNVRVYLKYLNRLRKRISLGGQIIDYPSPILNASALGYLSSCGFRVEPFVGASSQGGLVLTRVK
jgi:hypothetical protein